jgi:hypothetical protein
MSLLFNPTIKRAVSGCIDTLLMCAPTPPPPQRWTTTTGPTHHQEKKKSVIVIMTARSKLNLLLLRCVTPAPGAKVSPRGPQTYRRITPLALKRWGCRYYTGLLLEEAQEQAIQRWEIPRRPEYGRLTKSTRTFYQEAEPWDSKEQPSVESIAAAGFFDGGFIIIII